MRQLPILLAVLFVASAMKSGLPFFGPEGMEQEDHNYEPETGTEEDVDIIEPPEEEEQEEQAGVGDDEEEDEDVDKEDHQEEQRHEDAKDINQEGTKVMNQDVDVVEAGESRVEETEQKPTDADKHKPEKHKKRRGSRGRPGQFPYVAYIELIQCKCTGFLLTDRWLLTSSHCFLEDPLFEKLQTGRVYVGTPTIPVSKANLKHVQLRIISDVRILPPAGGVCVGGAGEKGGGETQESRCSETRAKAPPQEKKGCKKKGKTREGECGPQMKEGDQDESSNEEEPMSDDEEDQTLSEEGGKPTKESDGKEPAEGTDVKEPAEGGTQDPEKDGRSDQSEEPSEGGKKERLSFGEREAVRSPGDLALVKVDDKFEMTKHVGFIRLTTLPFPGSLECKVIGFSDVKPLREKKHIHWKNAEVWNGTKCNFVHSLTLDADALCSKGPVGRTCCTQDIGGPVVCMGSAAAVITYSLSEKGAVAVYDCNKRVSINVYVMGGAHLQWIQSVVPDLPQPMTLPENHTVTLATNAPRSFQGKDPLAGSGGGSTHNARHLFPHTSGGSALSAVLVGCGVLLQYNIM